MEEKKLEILYDHYKDTFDNQKAYIQKRNYYTLICLGIIAALSFQMYNPTESNSISNELIKKNIGEVKIDISYINNVLTFALLWVVIMYYQVNFVIEKTYKYIHDIEGFMSKELVPFKINREGETYLSHYPLLSEVTHRIYSILFPLTLIIVAFIKWYKEKTQLLNPWHNGNFWFDTIFLFGIILTSLLYLSNRHFNDFRKKKPCS